MPGTKAGAEKARAAREQAKLDEQKAAALKAADARLAAKVGPLRRNAAPTPAYYVVGHRPLKVDGLEYLPGEVVEGAESWPRVEAWVRARRLIPAYGERMTSPEQPEVEAAEPEDLEENFADAPEDDLGDLESVTGEELPEDEEVSK